MIDSAYTITCDGHDPDDPDGFCEAEFTIDVSGRLATPVEVTHQLDQRGWRTVTDPQPTRTICPLHPVDSTSEADR